MRAQKSFASVGFGTQSFRDAGFFGRTNKTRSLPMFRTTGPQRLTATRRTFKPGASSSRSQMRQHQRLPVLIFPMRIERPSCEPRICAVACTMLDTPYRISCGSRLNIPEPLERSWGGFARFPKMTTAESVPWSILKLRRHASEICHAEPNRVRGRSIQQTRANETKDLCCGSAGFAESGAIRFRIESLDSLHSGWNSRAGVGRLGSCPGRRGRHTRDERSPIVIRFLF